MNLRKRQTARRIFNDASHKLLHRGGVTAGTADPRHLEEGALTNQAGKWQLNARSSAYASALERKHLQPPLSRLDCETNESGHVLLHRLNSFQNGNRILVRCEPRSSRENQEPRRLAVVLPSLTACLERGGGIRRLQGPKAISA